MSHFITENCIICGTCFEICPTRSIVDFEWYYKIEESCAECGACVKVCPNGAIRKQQQDSKRDPGEKEIEDI